MCTTEEQANAMLSALTDIKTAIENPKKLSRLAGDATLQISSVQPLMLDYKDHKHLYIWSPQALTLQIEDLGFLSVPANTWQLLDYQEGMRLTPVGQANALPVFLHPTDELLSIPVPVVGSRGAILLSNPPTNTNAGADTPLPLAQPVNHFLIQNNSAALLYVELDAVASLASFQIAAGAIYRDNIQVSTLHFFTAAAQAMSGYVVRGWL